MTLLQNTPERPRPGGLWPLRGRGRPAAAVALVVSALLAAVLAAFLFAERSGSPSTARPVEPTAREVRRVHAVLHGIERRCPGGRAGPRVRERLEADAEVLVRFARRHPRARFPIDDESGRALSLLLVAREALLPCAPLAAARVDRALPPQYRTRP